ncbi:Fic family protein [Nitrospirillum amazonense]|uniref:Fic family protein n=1 Tax=Nitrospirillum amazonense TaxID=28077 RepID=A0A560FI32_9PROT|nr:Fic family protein [Nitrospirillum amazonense]TWB21270.1 Fic family protein [Nitrospirillum amazonense]
MYQPHFTITPGITKALMSIEAARQTILALPIDIDMLASLRETARLVATHYSTQIEGNRLTQAEVHQILAGTHIPGRERDQTEVRNYYRAIEEVERLAQRPDVPGERDVRRLHGLVMHGKATPTPYRDGQNVIREAATGLIIYMPPEAADVPALMADLMAWIQMEMDRDELPAPIIAAIAHYQFATIHPYYDGNGRTARLLTTLLLHNAGYGLKGIYSLDEYYARNLQGYYRALTVGPSHNYYMGRAEADITGFIAYFCEGMADAFAAVRFQADRAATRGAMDQSGVLRRLDPRQRRLWELLRRQGTATSAEIAANLGLSQRTVVGLCRDWVDNGFLEVHDPSRKNRAYRLAHAFDAK